MQVARVRGTIVSTHKEQSLTGVKFLLVQLMDEDCNPLPEYEVAADNVGAGVDEWVLISRGSAARQFRGGESKPIDALVVGIIDTISVDRQFLYSKREQDR